MPRSHAVPRHAAALLAALAASTIHAGTVAPVPDHFWIGPGCQFEAIADAIAVADASSGDVIHIVATTTAPRTGEAVIVDGKSIELSGGHPTCNDQSIIGRTTLSNLPYPGAHGSAVLTVTGNADVSVRNIDFTDGGVDSPGQLGGGIQLWGSGRLTLANVAVYGNVAESGGGIGVRADAGPATVVLLGGVTIHGNTVSGYGGGIHLEGDANLRAVAGGLELRGNSAEQGGGALSLEDGARAIIAAGGPSQPPVMHGNRAEFGGAISVNGSDDGRAASVHLFPRDPRHPPRIEDNSADAYGGALYVGAADGAVTATAATACITNARIDGNHSAHGAAVMAYGPFEPVGTRLPPNVDIGIDPAEYCNGVRPADHGGVACLPGVTCNTLHGNVAAILPTEAKGGYQPDGALVVAGNAAFVYLVRQDVRDNTATGALLHARYGGEVFATDSVFVRNTADGPLLRAEADGVVGASLSTLADNLHAGALIANSGDAGLYHSVVDTGGAPLAQSEAGSEPVDAQSIVATTLAGTVSASDSIVADPRFADADAGNYRLRHDSPAIDYVDTGLGWQSWFDIDGTPRGQNAPRPDRGGTFDLGAYEWTPDFRPGRVFADGLEAPLPHP